MENVEEMKRDEEKIRSALLVGIARHGEEVERKRTPSSTR